MAYEYRGCGLPNIFLENGFVEKETPYGVSVSIENLPGLHQAIGRWLAERPGKLTGAEFRFLRREMDLSQKRFGQMFNISEQSVANWEKGKTDVHGIGDRVIRVLYLEYIGQRNQNLLALLDFMSELDQEERAEVTFKESGSNWMLTESAA